MKYNREDRVKILEYKFVFEEELQVQSEFEEGAADLNYRLSFFREKLDKKKSIKSEKNRYDSLFMGRPKAPDESAQITQMDKSEITQSASKVSDDIKPWAKKLYRQIVMVTHPDKISEIQSDNLRNKLLEQYRVAQNAYNQNIPSDLIMVSYDLNLDIPKGVVAIEITPDCHKKRKAIQSIKEKIGWQWYHVPENQRDAELKKILHACGFSFTEEKITEVTKRKYVKRKTGTKPVSLRKTRLQ
jgi:hypothetical protein